MDQLIKRNVRIWRLGYNLDLRPILRSARQNPKEMIPPPTGARVPLRFWIDIASVAIMTCASLFWVGRVNTVVELRTQMLLGNIAICLGPSAISLGKEGLAILVVCFAYMSCIFMRNLTSDSARARHLAIRPLLIILWSKSSGQNRTESLYLKHLARVSHAAEIAMRVLSWTGVTFAAATSLCGYVYLNGASIADLALYGAMPTLLQMINCSHYAMNSVTPIYLAYSSIMLKIYHIRMVKREIRKFLAQNEATWLSSERGIIRLVERQREASFEPLKALIALKNLTSSILAADRDLWGKIYLTYIMSNTLTFSRLLYAGIFVTSQSALVRGIEILFSPCLYIGVMIALAIAGLFVKECRSLVALMTRMSFAWPRNKTQPHGQILILELVSRFSNPRRGVGLTFGGVTITKLATVKVTLQFARGLLLLVKKFKPFI